MFDHLPDGSVVADIPGRSTRVVVPPGGPRGPEEWTGDNGYPDIVLDQRRGYQGLETESPDEVVAHWERFLSRQRPPRIMVSDARSVTPTINHSRWVADCPECNGGMICWDRNPYTICLDCGHRYSVDWPTPALRSEVIRTIALRPVSGRNWDPRRFDKQGDLVETVEFLERENLLVHGRAR